MYYLLHYSFEDEQKDMWLKGTIYNKNKNVVKEIFDKGKILKESEIGAPFTIILNEKVSSIRNKKTKDKISTSVIESGFLFLISLDTKILFEELNIDNLQYIDVSIISSLVVINDYKIVNITDKIDCTDFSASYLDLYFDGDISSISKLVLDETKIPKGKLIFLLGKRETGIILVHENLKKAIENAKLTGFRFVELENADQLY